MSRASLQKLKNEDRIGKAQRCALGFKGMKRASKEEFGGSFHPETVVEV